MRKLAIVALAVCAAAFANAQYWSDNPATPLIPSQADISSSTPTAGPFAGAPGFMSGGQFQNGATNNFVMEFLSGTTDQGTVEASRGPVAVSCNINGVPQYIGYVTFNYGGMFGYVNNFNASSEMSGMMLRGGISLAPGLTMGADDNFRWVQMYQETQFNGTVGAWTIDSPAPATSPLYTAYTVPNPNNMGTMQAGLADVPFDGYGSSFKSVSFTSFLVCADTGTTNLELLGSFTWGYTHNDSGGGKSSDISSDFATAYQDGVYTNLAAINRALGAQSPGWTPTQGCDDCMVPAATPEPVTVALGAAALPLAYARIRRRKRMEAAAA